jgi:hypothetical protein
MRDALRRIGRDLTSRHNVEAYAVAGLAFVFAVLSVVGDVLPEGLRWAALFAGVGLLVYRLTLPSESNSVEDQLLDRASFDERPFAALVDRAREVWIFAPSAVNVLNPRTCEALRSKVLARSDGVVRVVVLDPDQHEAVRLAAKQLDDSVDFPVQQLGPSLMATLGQLRLMMSWAVPGSLGYRLLDYNPGFSLVAVDPGQRHGTVIVEFHGFHNESIISRMHIELRRSDKQQWYAYWIDQFDHIWHAARAPSDDSSGLSRPAAQPDHGNRTGDS